MRQTTRVAAWRRVAAVPLAIALLAAQTLGGWSRAIADTSAPIIRHAPIGTIAAGGTADVDATVTDDVGVRSVTLWSALSGAGAFTAQPMIPVGENLYRGVLSAEGLAPSEGIDYYITATDGTNEESRGFEFDPFTVSVTAAPTETPIASSTAGGGTIGETTVGGEPAVREGGTSRVWYVLGAVLAVGLVAGLAGGGSSGGGGSGEEPGDLPDPADTVECCNFVLR